MISDVSRRILEVLISRSDWMKTEDLIAFCNCSIRTIRNKIKEINSKNEYIISSSKGYRINNNFRDNIRFMLENSQSSNLEARYSRIIMSLIRSENKLDFYDLAESLFISESTLSNDLIKIRKKLQPHGLTIRRNRDCLILEGSEQDIRIFMAHQLRNEVKSGILNINVIADMFDDYPVRELNAIIDKIIQEHDYYINIFGMSSLLLHILIAIERVRNDYHINKENEGFGIHPTFIMLEDKQILQLTKKIISEIEAKMKLKFTANEIERFVLILSLNLKPYDESEIDLEYFSQYVEKDAFKIVDQIIKEVNRVYNLNLNNIEFKTRFSLHIQQIMSNEPNPRYEKNNPMFNSIKNAYPLFFEISVFIANVLNRKFGIELNEHDISYIALHIGMVFEENEVLFEKIKTIVIAPEYYDFADRIKYKIENSYGNVLNITGLYSNEQILAELDNDTAFVISTIPISHSFGFEAVQISPFLNELDQKAISSSIAYLNAMKMKQLKNITVSLFDKNLFKIISEKTTVFNIINNLSKEMINHKFVGNSYTEDVLERELMSSTAFKNIAIPHSIHMNAHKTVIGVNIIKNKNGMRWGENDVNTVFMFALKEEDIQLFKEVFQFINKVFTSSEYNKNISKIEDHSDFIELTKALMKWE